MSFADEVRNSQVPKKLVLSSKIKERIKSEAKSNKTEKFTKFYAHELTDKDIEALKQEGFKVSKSSEWETDLRNETYKVDKYKVSWE